MFKIDCSFSPSGDQPHVIDQICDSLEKGNKYQCILGATGTGKTFVMANIIAKTGRPALILSHNKTLTAQLYREFKEFFPQNMVEYFVSYFAYYQPEAYIPSSGVYIEKDSAIDQDLDLLRLSATTSLCERKDTIVVCSVSCIYGLGNPEYYQNMYLSLKVGQIISRHALILRLDEMLYKRNDDTMKRGEFRVRGDTLDVHLAYMEDEGIRIQLLGEEIISLHRLDILNGKTLEILDFCPIYPAKHFVVPENTLKVALISIRKELEQQYNFLIEQGKQLEAERLRSRTENDLDRLERTGHCPGIENYSRHLTNRNSGEAPFTLIDYFPRNFITFIDESHVSLPQLHAMVEGDRSRKRSLVDYGFRLESAYDNRPLSAQEFWEKTGQIVFVSATPAPWELQQASVCSQLIVRPTGLVDPSIEIRPSAGQVDDIVLEIQKTIQQKYRTLITTLTKKMCEALSQRLQEEGIQANYLHSEIDTLGRVEILKDLREGTIHALVGVNLLREGLDLPEVGLVIIVDADKIGFLRSKTALLQTVGRAARNKDGRVLMYADKISDAMKGCIEETTRRREMQIKYNVKNNITPRSIVKPIRSLLISKKDKEKERTKSIIKEIRSRGDNAIDQKKYLEKLQKELELAVKKTDFETAIAIRDEILRLNPPPPKK